MCNYLTVIKPDNYQWFQFPNQLILAYCINMKDINTTKKAKKANKKEFKKNVAKSLADSIKQVKGKASGESESKKKFNGFKKIDKSKKKTLQSDDASAPVGDKPRFFDKSRSKTADSKEGKPKKPYTKFVKKEFKPIFKDTVYDKSKTKLYNSKKPNTQLVCFQIFIIFDW